MRGDKATSTQSRRLRPGRWLVPASRGGARRGQGRRAFARGAGQVAQQRQRRAQARRAVLQRAYAVPAGAAASLCRALTLLRDPRIPPALGWEHAPRVGPRPGLGSCCCCRCCSGCWPPARRRRGAEAAPRRTATAALSTPSRRASAACSARTTCASLRRWVSGPRPRSPCPGRRAPGAEAGLGRARPPRRGRGVPIPGTGVAGLRPEACLASVGSGGRFRLGARVQSRGAPSVPRCTSPWTLPPRAARPGFSWGALTPTAPLIHSFNTFE